MNWLKRHTTGNLVFLFTISIFLILFLTISLFVSFILLLVESGRLAEIGLMTKAFSIILCAVAILAIGTLFSNFFVRIPLRPIRRLIDAMRKLADGHFEERLDMDEVFLGDWPLFRELGDSFNTLASELQSTEMLRTDFVNNFSHEFKTPIVSIRGFSKILQHGNLSEQERREYLDIIYEESTRLADMATNVLTLTKIENQAILTNATTYNLSEQIRKCILLLEKKWTGKELQISAEFSEYAITGNMEQLQQVWLNLLDNAIKFSPSGSEVEVGIRRVGGGMLVLVRNHGPEITQEQQKRLYDKFWQGDASRSSEGTGIGLSIVKKVVDLHRGKISVTSNSEQTTFCVFLPQEAAGEPGAARLLG